MVEVKSKRHTHRPRNICGQVAGSLDQLICMIARLIVKSDPDLTVTCHLLFLFAAAMLEFLTVGLTSLLVASDTLWASWANPSFDFTICSVDGRIYTVNETQPTVDCLAIKQGRIADTQSYCEALSSNKHVPKLIIKHHEAEALQQHSSWYSWLSRRKISLVESNSIIVPGLAGNSAFPMLTGYVISDTLSQTRMHILLRMDSKCSYRSILPLRLKVPCCLLRATCASNSSAVLTRGAHACKSVHPKTP